MKTKVASNMNLFVCVSVCLSVCRPDGYTYHKFRAQFVLFSIYLSKSHLKQFFESHTILRTEFVACQLCL